MDPTIDAMLLVYAAALRRHQQHLDDGCDRIAWHTLACHLIKRAVWSANSTEEAGPGWSAAAVEPQRVQPERPLRRVGRRLSRV
jgi:hypothetical protein